MYHPSHEQFYEMTKGFLTSDSSFLASHEPEEVARFFHETYERLAPDFGYSTRKDSAVQWKDVPEKNKQLMIAVASEVIKRFIER